MADELLPAGIYDSIEEAERATGFKIPHARTLNGFLLDQVKVEGPEYGIIGEGDQTEFANLRSASLKYTLGTDQRWVSVTVFRAETNGLQPVQGAGPAQEVRIAGHKALLQQNSLADGRARTVFAQWLDDGLLVSAHAFLTDGLLMSGQTVEPGLTLDEVLGLLNSFE